MLRFNFSGWGVALHIFDFTAVYFWLARASGIKPEVHKITAHVGVFNDFLFPIDLGQNLGSIDSILIFHRKVQQRI